MDKLRRILILEENTDHLELLTGILEKNFSPIDIHTVETIEDALDFLEQTDYDLVMTGCFIRNICITERLKSVVERANGTPIFVISGSGDEGVAAEVIKLGGSEYLVKDRKAIEKLPGLVGKYFKKGRKTALKSAPEDNETVSRLLRELDHLMQKARTLTLKGDADAIESLFSQIHRLRKLIQDQK